MPFKIVRNDIVRMQCDAIVNTANAEPVCGTGCDRSIYNAAGREELLRIRKKIGPVPEGEVFLTPGLRLPAKYIIHAVSPLYIDGAHGEEEKLRSCYRKSLKLAAEHKCRSIAFPLISAGAFGYPKEEAVRIAADECRAFLKEQEMEIFLVVFGEGSVKAGIREYPGLRQYIDRNYVEEQYMAEYGHGYSQAALPIDDLEEAEYKARFDEKKWKDEYGKALAVRMRHLKDTFSEYLLYLIESKGMTNAEVYKRALVDKKLFAKIKNDPDYHPTKMTAMCLCIGARLNLDETTDLLSRAGYALSPCSKTDIIFRYFIEHGIYDMIELDIQLEEYGEQTLIS